ncbi:MAG: hypothetical protein GY862_37230 [Gammaproteobacteria bacterium]|nr:hypothetical protein [Gammaproteobacteria bacterium]
MIFLYNLNKYELFILIAGVLALAAVVYYFAVRSRKVYTCPECGEEIRVEHMETERCNICGALLKREEQ